MALPIKTEFNAEAGSALAKLEVEKLNLERTKAWLTAASIILPLVASLATYALTLRHSRTELDLKRADREINSKIEFLKLITQRPELRDQAIKNWKQVFQDDEWLREVEDSGAEK